MTPYPIPAEQTRAEIIVKKSRFIATIAPVFDVGEAKAFVKRIKLEFADATHNVSAYQVGFGASTIAHSSDDGEPSGTAGRPSLAVLQGSGLGDAALVVTRYYGGTKLGTGGLARAYGEAAKAAVAAVRRAEKTWVHTAVIPIPYALFDQVLLLVEAWNGRILEKTFAAEIALTVQFAVNRFDGFQEALSELSHGRLQAEITVANQIAIVALNDKRRH